ncbi:flagellum-associated coiled-coil domain-containing protein 1 isoform X3 [Rhinolophus ferrumequinum]|uniref:flagellum-associated coiled-coil domain-containing protein 1 isoform X3 n=1 Tax=Rhinolophus ferrumequinum TaxID=59479 RepID=UPI00140FD076|nr:flagellum-associated coiled-coil domain-containing protein 1 isoform X3 [Rhinolophus ferrumequinum]
MYPNPLTYCTCWDPWNLGPRKLIKTPQPPRKRSTGKPQLAPLPPPSKNQNYVQPTTKAVASPKVKIHSGKQEESNKLPYLSNEMNLRCAEMQKNFENKNRELKEAHAAELTELKNKYKAALEAEKLAAQEKLEEMEKEYKYLKNVFHTYQESICDEMEDKWSKKKAEWEKNEQLEREKILLHQKNQITKRFELKSEEEKKRINDSYSAALENFNREKEELLKQHEKDTLQLEELKKTKEVIEEELNAQTIVLESLNTILYHTQMELQKKKAVVGNLEKTFQTKFAESEEKFKYTIQLLTEENIHLRQKIIAKNEEIYEERLGKSTSVTIYEDDSNTLEDSSNKR